jgi:EAL domain-containing protein (putative c-di-GMP-specific phosphodiesterase class I)
MRDVDGALILPADFFPAAERYDLASRIDRWVIRALFKWLVNNQSIMHRLGVCAVNLSGQTLGDEGFQQEVIALVENSSVPAEKICFEITETAAITNLSSATTFMKRMKAHGCKFSLDDFGRGLSSFAYLKNLPVDFVKIDGLFVKDILTDPVDHAMVKAIIDMAHALGKKAIAEFVEDNEILNALIDLDVDYVQGYGIARPVRLA